MPKFLPENRWDRPRNASPSYPEEVAGPVYPGCMGWLRLGTWYNNFNGS